MNRGAGRKGIDQQTISLRSTSALGRSNAAAASPGFPASPGKPPAKLGGGGGGGGSSGSGPLLAAVPAVLKSAGGGKGNGGKKKKMSKAELETATKSLLEEYLGIVDLEEATKCVAEMKAPSYAPSIICAGIMLTVERKEVDRSNISKLFAELHKAGLVSTDAVADGVQMVLEQVPDLSIDVPMIHTYVASFLAAMVTAKIASLKDLSRLFVLDGALSKTYVALLKALSAASGDEGTFAAAFKEAGVDILKVLPEGRRTEDYLIEVLAPAGLTFLFPMLQLKQQLRAQLEEQVQQGSAVAEGEVHPGVKAVYKWLLTMPAAMQKHARYTHTVTYEAIRHVALLTTLKEAARGAEPDDAAAAKSAKKEEEALMVCMAPLIQRLAGEDTHLQIQMVYSLQVYAYEKGSPKGFMLRMAKSLYDLDIVEEDAFSAWREEINDEFPGKGDALVDLNEYLNWMRTAVESSSEEEGDEDEDEDSDGGE